MGEPSKTMITAFLDQVRAAIREHGWIVQAAPITSDDGTTALIAYTVGMAAHGLPELLIMDPPTPWHAMNILNTVCHIHRARPGGIPTPSIMVIEETPYAVAEMPPDLAACIRVARAIYGTDVRVLMLITKDNVEEARR